MTQRVSCAADGVVHDVEQTIDMPGNIGTVCQADTKPSGNRRTHRQQVEPLALDGRRRDRFLAPRFGDQYRPLYISECGKLPFKHALNTPGAGNLGADQCSVVAQCWPVQVLPDEVVVFHKEEK